MRLLLTLLLPACAHSNYYDPWFAQHHAQAMKELEAISARQDPIEAAAHPGMHKVYLTKPPFGWNWVND